MKEKLEKLRGNTPGELAQKVLGVLREEVGVKSYTVNSNAPHKFLTAELRDGRTLIVGCRKKLKDNKYEIREE